jgi:hypothetical protein
MYITVTSIQLKRPWHFFRLSLLALRIMRQLKHEKGLLEFKKRGIGRLHYTLTAWETEADLKRFARSGAHLAAMKTSGSIASEIRTCTFTADSLPEWKDAQMRLLDEGRVLTY